MDSIIIHPPIMWFENKKFEDNIELIRSCTSKNRQYNGQRKMTKKDQAKIHNTMHKKIKIEQHDPLFQVFQKGK